MAVSMNKFNAFLKTQMNGGFDGTTSVAERVIDFDTDNLKVALLTTATAPVATLANFGQITTEVVAGGYTAGGIALTAKTLVEGSGLVTFDAADVTWTANASGFSNAQYAVIYKVGTTAANSTLVAWVDFGAAKTNVGGDFSIVWNAAGIVTWQ